MTDKGPAVLALDFDGVLCDGRPEYFETAWRAYARTWPAPALTPEQRDALARAFSSRRPLIESGWEFPLLVRALVTGERVPPCDERAGWLTLAHRIATDARVSTETLKQHVNDVRDQWFAADPGDWVAHHQFYPGVLERVGRAVDEGVVPAIVTTKAERFTRALLGARSERLAKIAVMGWDGDQIVPKAECLRRLVTAHTLPSDGTGLWFVEDMLETLEKIEHAPPPLAGARLLLADWGYNTPAHRDHAREGDRVRVVDLTRFIGPFADW